MDPRATDAGAHDLTALQTLIRISTNTYIAGVRARMKDVKTDDLVDLIADVPAMDALVEGPVNRYTAGLDAGIRHLHNGGHAARDRGRRIAAVGLVPYEWVVIGFFAGLFLPSVLLHYLGAREAVG